jgi:hypothetical protein
MGAERRGEGEEGREQERGVGSRVFVEKHIIIWKKGCFTILRDKRGQFACFFLYRNGPQ